MNRVAQAIFATVAWATMAAFALPALAQTAPTMTGAASRRVHGVAGTFDVTLATDPVNPSVEPRTGPTHTVVFTFNKPVTGGSASIAEGVATTGAPTYVGSEMRVPLTGVTNAQYVTLSVTNVTAADGGTGGTGSIRVGFLAGDVNQNRVITLSDVGLINAQLAQPVTAANFLRDVNASGTITLGDKVTANNVLATQLPPPINTPPVANAGPAQGVAPGVIVYLDGSASSDADGFAADLQLDADRASRREAAAALVSPTTVSPSFIADLAGTYTLSLVVNDGSASSAASIVTRHRDGRAGRRRSAATPRASCARRRSAPRATRSTRWSRKGHAAWIDEQFAKPIGVASRRPSRPIPTCSPNPWAVTMPSVWKQYLRRRRPAAPARRLRAVADLRRVAQQQHGAAMRRAAPPAISTSSIAMPSATSATC